VQAVTIALATLSSRPPCRRRISEAGQISTGGMLWDSVHLSMPTVSASAAGAPSYIRLARHWCLADPTDAGPLSDGGEPL